VNRFPIFNFIIVPMNKLCGSSVVVFCLVFFSLSGCGKKEVLKQYKINGLAQGTYYAISYFSANNEDLQPAVDSLFKEFDRSVSAYQPNSILSRFNNNDSTVLSDAIYETVFKESMEVSAKTDGAFDVTVGPVVNAWGFGLSKRSNVDKAVIDSLLPLVGYHKIQLVNGKLRKEDQRIRVDFNAIAQGYTSDWLAIFFESKGIQNYLIDVGGEVLGRGSKPDGRLWSVGIELPARNAEDERKIQAIISLKDLAISTSGSYRKYYVENGIRYSHTIDPVSGYPVKHNLLSVSVLAKDCMTADAFATAFMVMGLDKSKEFLSKNRELEAYFISDDQKGGFSVYATPGFEMLLNKN
jgi:thiamine biosynthesis lipoprotein